MKQPLKWFENISLEYLVSFFLKCSIKFRKNIVTFSSSIQEAKNHYFGKHFFFFFLDFLFFALGNVLCSLTNISPLSPLKNILTWLLTRLTKNNIHLKDFIHFMKLGLYKIHFRYFRKALVLRYKSAHLNVFFMSLWPCHSGGPWEIHLTLEAEIDYFSLCPASTLFFFQLYFLTKNPQNKQFASSSCCALVIFQKSSHI